MVLPEELVNYVKDQLAQDVPVATIIADVKAKGYQISSSTIYKIRAMINPRHEEQYKPLALATHAIDKLNEIQSSTPAWNFLPIEIAPSTGALLAAVDIQDLQIIVHMMKNGQNILVRTFQYQLNNADTVEQILQNVYQLCQEMCVTNVVITSYFLKEQNERTMVTLSIRSFDLAPYLSPKTIVVNHDEAIASRYVKLLQKDVIVLTLDDIIGSVLCERRSLTFQRLQLQHSMIARHQRDQRPLGRCCERHQFCAQALCSTQSVQNIERDVDLIAVYVAQIIYNADLARPDCCYILAGRLTSAFGGQRFAGLVKHHIIQLHGDGIADTLVHYAAPDAAAIGAVQILERKFGDDVAPVVQFASPMRSRVYSRPATAVDVRELTTPYELDLLANMAKDDE